MTSTFEPAPDASASGPSLERFAREIPKVELHCHLLGAIRRETFHDLARLSGRFEASDVDELFARAERRQGAIPALRALEEKVLREPSALYRLTREYLEDARAHNVLYAEFFWNPTGVVVHSGVPYRQFQEAIVRAIEDARQDLGIEGRLIPAIDREASPAAAEEMVGWIVEARHDLVPGIGIDYRENLGAPDLFTGAFSAARRAGLKSTAHAGEVGMPWTNVRDTLDLLHVDRIDHGYTIIDNDELVQRCVDSGMVFTIVPTNSYYLRTLSPERWGLDHPVRQMLARGLRVHPNSDDPTLHNTSPTQAWALMVEQFGCRVEDLRALMHNGLDGAWMDDAVRARLKPAWNATFDELLAQHFPSPARPTPNHDSP